MRAGVAVLAHPVRAHVAGLAQRHVRSAWQRWLSGAGGGDGGGSNKTPPHQPQPAPPQPAPLQEQQQRRLDDLSYDDLLKELSASIRTTTASGRDPYAIRPPNPSRPNPSRRTTPTPDDNEAEEREDKEGRFLSHDRREQLFAGWAEREGVEGREGWLQGKAKEWGVAHEVLRSVVRFYKVPVVVKEHDHKDALQLGVWHKPSGGVPKAHGTTNSNT